MKSIYSDRISFVSIYLLSLSSLTSVLPASAQSSTPTNTTPGQTQTSPTPINTTPGQTQTSPTPTNTTPGQTQTSPTRINTTPGQTQTSALNAVDRQFVTTAAQSDLAEIQTSQLALKRSSNPQVLKYAREMIQMHTDSTNKLKPIAARLNLALPTSLRAEDRAVVNQLQTLSGTPFDRAYLNGQMQGHAKTQAAYQQELQQGQNSELKAFAREILPMVTMHLQMARSLTAMR